MRNRNGEAIFISAVLAQQADICGRSEAAMKTPPQAGVP